MATTRTSQKVKFALFPSQKIYDKHASELDGTLAFIKGNEDWNVIKGQDIVLPRTWKECWFIFEYQDSWYLRNLPELGTTRSYMGDEWVTFTQNKFHCKSVAVAYWR